MTECVDYAELHAHTAFSFLDGASHPEQMVAEAARLGLSALAITDHNGLYGVVRAQAAARAVGLPMIYGAELSLPVTDHRGRVSDPQPAAGVPDPQATHLVALARGPQGYGRLSHALGMGHLAAGAKGHVHVTDESLAEIAAGHWLVLTGCRKGAVRSALEVDGRITAQSFVDARRELDRLVALFGRDNVAVEITDHGDPRDHERNAALADLALDAGVPLVATTNAHYARANDADLAAALAAIRSRQSLTDMEGWLSPTGGMYLRSAAEMRWRHREHPQAVSTAARLGAECAFDLSLVAPRLPPYPVPPGHSEASWLRELTLKGASERYGPRGDERIPGAWEQIDRELQVIESLDFPGYFLIVHDIVAFCRSRNILCQGRGSAANSAVCYALGVTAVDAVQHGLLFERFLSADRDGPPDIDVDIESDRREEVIQYVFERFGRINAAMVANVIQYRPRSAIRDAARALGYDAGLQDAWASSVDRWSQLEPDPTQHQEWAVSVRDATWPDAGPSEDIPGPVLSLARQLMRLPRHLGIHPGGMVLCDRPVIDVCPVEWGRMPGRSVLQWDKDDCADAGLVKFDLLGLGMLSALKHAFTWCAEVMEEQWDLHTLPQEDPAVYDLLCAADTVGVFQVESRAQMSTLPRLQPRCFYDIVIEVALIRPGPIQGGAVHPYINRVRGREPVTYLHPSLEPALKKTMGIPLFQEQLMQIAMAAAGFDGAMADQLRRAMGSKRSVERMEALRARFMVGAHDRGIDAATATAIFDTLKAFADFGFPESHSFSFAYLVYASAWLKVHYPAAFYAGLLAAQPMGFYSPQSLVADARRHGQVTRSPCVMASGVLASVEYQDTPGPVPADCRDDLARLVRVNPHYVVRMGLAAISGISTDVAQAIVDARNREPFTSVTQMARAVTVGGKPLTTSQWEALATAGALEALGVSRREGLWSAGLLARDGEHTLPDTLPALHAPALPEMSAQEVAVADVRSSGVTPDSYPTAMVRSALDAQGVLSVHHAILGEPERRISVAGVVTHRQRPATARGVTFLSLEDETGILNVVCSVGAWTRFAAVARRSPALVIRGRLERSDGATNLVAEHMAPLSLTIPTTSRDFR